MFRIISIITGCPGHFPFPPEMSHNRRYIKTILQILIAVISGIALNLLTNTIEDPLKHVFRGEAYQYVIWLLLLILIALYFVDARFGDGTTQNTAKSPRQELIDGLFKRFEKRLEQKMDSELRFEIHLNLQYTHERASERFRIDTLGEENAGDFNTLFQRFTGEIRRLLIVGEPGSGKTVLLLKFARRLLELAKQDPDYPVPVILNLATWRNEGQPFETWVEQNLVYAAGEYGASKEQAKELIKDNKLLLLLDGLDEAPETDRDSCLQKLFSYLRTINARRGPSQTYPEVIICSRREEYNVMMAEAPVHATVLIQPLQPAQVQDALQTIRSEQGKGFSADRLLDEVNKNPTLLNILTTAFFVHIGLKLAEDDAFNFAVITKSADLVNVYVRQQINKIADRYAPEKAVSWLSWLADKLTQTRKGIIFELADMQPQWLRREWLFIFLKSITGGLLFGLMGIVFNKALEDFIIIGFFYACIVFIWDNSNWNITIEYRQSAYKYSFKKNIYYTMTAFFVLGCFLYAVDPIANQSLLENISVGFVISLLFSLILGTPLGFLFSLLRKFINNKLKIKINKHRQVYIKTKESRVVILKIDKIKLKVEFLIGFKKGIVAGAIIGFIVIVIGIFFSKDFKKYFIFEGILDSIGKFLGLFIVVIFFILVSSVTVGLVSGIIAGFTNTFIRKQRYPRIQNPYRRFYASIWSTYFQYIAIIFILSIIFENKSNSIQSLIRWALGAAIFSLPLLLLTSSLYQHFILRLCLYIEGSLLFRFVTFLNYVSKKTGLLENDGGQWRFRHQLIQDTLIEKEYKSMPAHDVSVGVINNT